MPELIKSAIKLEAAGADFIIMPCHSAHIWFNELKNAVKIPFYNMIQNTAQTILKQKSHKNKTIILLATETTINGQLYQKAFENSPVKIIIPSLEEQRALKNAIKNVKAGRIETNPHIHELNQFLKNYTDKGISILIGCCTEIPLLFPYLKVEMEMIDPTLMLAKMAINKANH